jgi:hypothetical protein
MNYRIEIVKLIWISNKQTYKCGDKWKFPGTYLESMCTTLEYSFLLLFFCFNY